MPMPHVYIHVLKKTFFCPCFDTEQDNPGIYDSMDLKPFIKEKNPKHLPLSHFSGSRMVR